MTGRAASGARLLGDDVQHLVVWYHVLRALRAGDTTTSIRVEAVGVGNVDDLVVERSDAPPEYWQVKASVDSRSPANTRWLMEHDEGQLSLLRRVHNSWVKIETETGTRASVVLATTKNVDPEDVVLRGKDRRGRVDDALRTGTGALAEARSTWARHIGVTETELLEFLKHVEIRTGIDEHGWREKVRDAGYAAGIRVDDEAITLGLQTVRDWVKDPRSVFTPDELGRIVDDRGLRVESTIGLLVVQTLEESSHAEDATVAIDWVEQFIGDEPRVRRRLVDPFVAPALMEELVAARRTFREYDHLTVEVTGSMRLPTWFAVGAHLSRTAGFELKARCGTANWSTGDRQSKERLMLAPVEPSAGAAPGAPWVLCVDVSWDISRDAVAYAELELPDAVFLHARPTAGSAGDAFTDGGDAVRFAVELRDRLRHLRTELRPAVIHLFLAMPGAGALVLGHLWDRMPDTLTYWDLNESDGTRTNPRS